MSRTNARSRRLRRRPSRTVPAAVVAAVLLAAGVLTAVAAVARLVSGSWADQVTGPAGTVAALTWGSTAVVASGAVVAVLGVVLLVAGLTPGAFRTARLSPATLSTASGASGALEDTDYVISTRAMARLAAAGADRVDGVDRVAASASGRRVRVRVTTTSEQSDEIRTLVHQGVVDTLAAAGVSPAPKVSATVRTKEI